MIGVFSAGILGALVHLVFVTHVILENGTVAELDPETGVPIPENEDGNPLDEGCPYMAELTAVRTLISADVVAILVVCEVGSLPQVEPKSEVPALQDIYRLAPSNSPPLTV